MLRLTLRSGRHGRFLTRIVDPGTGPFVLDFGDRRLIVDAHQRLLHGFTMWRFGQLLTVTPQDPDILALMAEFYVAEGLLVSFEEPNWPGRLPSDLPLEILDNPSSEPTFDDLPNAEEVATEIVNLHALAESVQHRIQSIEEKATRIY